MEDAKVLICSLVFWLKVSRQVSTLRSPNPKIAHQVLLVKVIKTLVALPLLAAPIKKDLRCL